MDGKVYIFLFSLSLSRRIWFVQNFCDINISKQNFIFFQYMDESLKSLTMVSIDSFKIRVEIKVSNQVALTC